jgi:hypothetical protein
MGAMSNELKNKLLGMIEKGMDLNAILLGLLEQRDVEIVEEKEELAQKESAKAVALAEASIKVGDTVVGREGDNVNATRYISVRVKKVIALEHGKKCAAPACGRDAEVIHHTARFALSGAHDPRYLAPLCSEHHLIAHSVDVRFWRKRRV